MWRPGLRLAAVQEGGREAGQPLRVALVEVAVLVAELQVAVEGHRAQVGEVLDLVRAADPRRDEGQGEKPGQRRRRPFRELLTRSPRTRPAAAAPARPRSNATASSKAARAIRSDSASSPSSRASPSASAAGSSGGTSQRVLPVAEELAARREVGGDDRPPGGHRLEGLQGRRVAQRHLRPPHRHRDHRAPAPARGPPRPAGPCPRSSTRSAIPSASARARTRPSSASPGMPPRITRRAAGTRAIASTRTSTPFHG